MKKEGKYGEETKMVNFRVPKSKVSEISQMVKLKLLEYEKDILMLSERQFTEIPIQYTGTNKQSYDGDKIDSLLIDKASQYVKPKEIVKPAKKSVDMNALRAIANGEGLKSELFAKKKVNIDEEYEFEVVKSLPDLDDQVYIDKKQIALYDKYDSGVFYIKWEGRYLKFENKKEFDRFCKNNDIK